jgi:beta-mannosidase
MQLSGDWDVFPTPLELNGPLQTLSISNTTSIQVPDSTHLQRALYPEQPYWGENIRKINEQAWIYRRIFQLPAIPHRRARLLFEGVDYFASIWIDDRFVGSHEGHFLPFTLDVTGLLEPECDHTLLVRVSSPWDDPNPGGTYPLDHVLRGLVKGLYEHGEGLIPPAANPIGIWRPVWLLLDQGLSVDHVRIRTDIDGTLKLRVTATNATRESWQGRLSIQVSAETHDGPGVRSLSALRVPPGEHDFNIDLSIPEPRLWWPWDHGQPDLYRLRAELVDSTGQVLSAKEEVFGLRTVRLDRSPDRFTYEINGRPVFVRGSSYMPALYLSECNPHTLAQDVDLARQANLNLLRVHVHVSPPELYDLCNRAGMMIWQDFELNWIHDTSPEFEQRARTLQREMINTLGNHPAVITWICHNEPTLVFMRRANLEERPGPALYADAMKQDPTRPVFICSGQLEDDWQRSGDAHSYYGSLWSARYSDMYRHRYRLNTEFGFEAPAHPDTLKIYPDVWKRLDHLEDDIEALWDYQARLIQFQVEHLRRLRAEGCGGYIHFWLIDLVPQVGCGVLDSTRRPKAGYEALRRASQPLHIALQHDGRRCYAIWVFNDTAQPFLNTRLHCQITDETGGLLLEERHTFDITQNTSQPITPVKWRLSASDCARVKLALYDHDGELLADNVYEYPLQPPRRPHAYPWKFDPYLGTKVFDRPGASSLADQTDNRLIKLIPVAIRERIGEWSVRQRLPSSLLSLIGKILDRL